jgi:hypothetical protein
MEDKFLKIILLTLLFGVFGYITMMIYAHVHEDVHVAIYRSYKVNSTSTFNYWTGEAYTKATGNYSACNENCRYEHNLNEIVGYNLAIFIFTICSLTFIVFLSLIIFERQQRHETE